MGLEFLFGPAALLVFVAFLMVAMIVSAMVFRKGFNQLGWHRVLRGYLGVFAAVVAVTVVSVEFPLDNFLSHLLLQSHLLLFGRRCSLLRWCCGSCREASLFCRQ